MDIPILYQDDQLLVLDKPPGLVVDSSETQKTGTLQEILENAFKITVDRGGIVHRLDKDTSGLILVAKSQPALEQLQFQFKERLVKKQYLALVHGTIEQKGIVSGSIERNPGDRRKFIVSEEGKEASTEYEPVQRLQITEDRLHEIFEGFTKIQMRKLHATTYNLYTLVRCFPLTGRTHQIRVHLKYINHPIVGDEKYGGRKTARLDKRWCPRQFLHAAKIVFYHPATGQKMEFESPLPADLTQALTQLVDY